ncbi:MAG: hypothetical protein JW779_02190, partial [Candidatus Thorarchaeota archaeon]|nr:hypothetical protein [Candidatus Thorarchaeota archaeon]
MKRKSVLLAVVVASLFMLGIMIFQGEAPAVVSLGESSLQIIENPVDIPRVADEVDAAGNMLINVNENPSFEDWTGSGPASYDWASATAYREADFAYSGSGVTGNYGLLIESESSSTTDGGGYVSRQIPSSPSPLVEPGISLSFDWNVLENQAYDGGGRTFIIVSTYDGVSKYRNINYILSGNNPIGNYTSDAYFYLNDTLDEWHSFSRSITDDYIAVWGAGDLSSSQYVAYVQLKTYASAGVYGIISVAFDNIVLTDGSYSSWIANGDFETGTQSPWDASRSSRAYLEQSTDSTHETYSLNMSIPEITAGSGNVNTYKEFDYPGGFFASSPGMMYFDIDWKYNDTPSASHQSGRLTLWTRNTTSSYWLSIYFGTMDNTLNALSNYTSQYFFKMPGFGTKDIWQYTRIDIYDYLSSAGFSNVSLYQVEFAIQNSAPGASVFLLLDDFQIITYPLGDPGFEEDWYQDAVTPFAGWDDYNGGPTNILRSTDAYQGNYACKLTGVYQNTVGVYRDEDIPVNRNDLTNFSWRIDTIGNDNAWAIVRVLFTDSHYFNYLLGGGSSQPFGNASASCTFYVESFNNTGTWNLLQRNLTADYEAAFGSSANLVIDQLVLRMSVGTNGGLTILFDEM